MEGESSSLSQGLGRLPNQPRHRGIQRFVDRVRRKDQIFQEGRMLGSRKDHELIVPRIQDAELAVHNSSSLLWDRTESFDTRGESPNEIQQLWKFTNYLPFHKH